MIGRLPVCSIGTGYAAPMSRIIAGRARGAQLRAPAGERTRPTTDRVREALFSMLATWAGAADAAPEEQLADVRLLDLYAGSGAIGLEAVSRGASRAVLVENHRQALESIRHNVAAGSADRPCSSAACQRGHISGRFSGALRRRLARPALLNKDTAEVEAVLARVTEGWLAGDGLVVVERSRRDPSPAGLRRSQTTGRGATVRPSCIRTPGSRSRGGPMSNATTDIVRAVCPGSFDPITRGHLDIIARAAAVFSEVFVAVGRNTTKNYMYNTTSACGCAPTRSPTCPNVKVAPIEGLLVNFYRERNARVIVKGVRFSSDFDYELQMSQLNRQLSGVETVLLPAGREFGTISSSLLREVAFNGADISLFVTDTVNRAVLAKVGR